MPYADPIMRAAYHREWRRRNRDRNYRRYREQVAVYNRMYQANRRAAAYGAPGVITTADVRAVLAAGECYYCGATASRSPGGKALGIDHVVSLHARGPNTRENLVCCCHACNASKHRSDRPGRWSWEHDECLTCGSTDRPHVGHGLCRRCYGVIRNRRYGARRLLARSELGAGQREWLALLAAASVRCFIWGVDRDSMLGLAGVSV
jgi:hypothetical protein